MSMRWRIIAGITLVVLAVAVWRVLSWERERRSPGTVQQQQSTLDTISDDQAVVPKQMFIGSLKDARALNGKSVWMKTGYTIPYYAYRTGRIVFAHEEGRLPPTQELHVKDFTEATTPQDWMSSVPRGQKNVFVVFTEPGREGEFAAPVAALNGTDSTWMCDDLFFYQDPQTLYHWPPEVWKAVSAHTAINGMSEFRTTMSLGNLQQSESKNMGNRTVTYTTMDRGQTHHVSVTFEDDKATSVKTQ